MVSSARTHTYTAFLKMGRTVQRALGTMVLCSIGSLQNQYVPVHHAFKQYNKSWLFFGFLFCFFVVVVVVVCLLACLFCLIVVLFVLSLFLLLFWFDFKGRRKW